MILLSLQLIYVSGDELATIGSSFEWLHCMRRAFQDQEVGIFLVSSPKYKIK